MALKASSRSLVSIGKHKKGIFYTVTAIVLMSLVIYSFSLSFSAEMQRRTKVAESLVYAMDDLFEDIERDMGRAAHISSYRAILSFEEYIVNTGNYIGDTTPPLEDSFAELFFNGTMDDTGYFLMENNTFTNWTDKMIARANDLYVVMNYSIDGFRVYQDNPWTFKVDVNMSVDLTDTLGIATFFRDLTATAEIDIDEFDDPFYVVKTNQNHLVKFRQTPYGGIFVNGSNTTGFGLHVNDSYYYASTEAPSFLMRFEDNLGDDPNGIEAFIKQDMMGDLTADCAYTYRATNRMNRSMADHQYCNPVGTSYENFTVDGMFEEFRIDNQSIVFNLTTNITHIELYDLENHVSVP